MHQLLLQVPWPEGFSQFQEDQTVIFLCKAGKGFFKFITHNKRREKIDLATLRMHTRNRNQYPQQVSMREKLGPSHWKNDKIIKCLLYIFKSTYVIKLHPNFTRRYYRWNEIALELILCKVLLPYLYDRNQHKIKKKLKKTWTWDHL